MKFRRLVASLIALWLVAGVSSLAEVQEKKKERKLSKQEQQDAQALVKLADAGTAVSYLPVAWEQAHFVKAADGKTFIPFTLKVDTKSEVSLYVRAVAKAAAPPAKGMKVEYPWDDIQFVAPGPDGRFSRALSVAPGEYDLFIAVKEKSTGKKGEVTKTTVLKRDLSVPDFTKAELRASSVILAQNIEAAQPLDMDAQRANPYTFAGMKVTPSLDAKFKKSGELNLVFWIYGVAPTSMQKPDVQVEYSFNMKDGEGWKYFNKTAPQMLNDKSFPPEFSLAVGHLVTGSLSIPLSSFDLTDYKLDIKITDKAAAGKSITEHVTFAVTE